MLTDPGPLRLEDHPAAVEAAARKMAAIHGNDFDNPEMADTHWPGPGSSGDPATFQSDYLNAAHLVLRAARAALEDTPGDDGFELIAGELLALYRDTQTAPVDHLDDGGRLSRTLAAVIRAWLRSVAEDPVLAGHEAYADDVIRSLADRVTLPRQPADG
jgi:hypothetical protein